MHLKHEAFSEMIHLMKVDKKSDSGEVSFPLISHIGKPELVKGVDADLIYESFHFFNS
jgi:3-dehydroquinate synthetase